MIRSTVETALEYDVLAPTHFLFHIEAAERPGQQILSERLAVSSGVSVHGYRDDASGNRFIRFDAPVGPLMINYQAEVLLEPPPAIYEDLPEVPVGQLPNDVMHYLMPTRYCESDVMMRAATQLFGDHKPGLSRVRAISDWIHESITYEPGSTDSTTTAQEVFVQRAGVCRDFAHLGITLCRALNIPARLAVGYVWFNEPPQDFHAIFEAFVGGRWVLFDPTGMAPPERLVRIGTGRDAKDVAFSTIFGPVQMTRKEVKVDERVTGGEALAAPAAPAAAADPELRTQVRAELTSEDA